MKILYFAWLRERLNRGSDEFDLPAEVKTVGGLLDWMASNDESAEHLFSERSLIRVAVNQKLVGHDASLGNSDTVALFPPMTGG